MDTISKHGVTAAPTILFFEDEKEVFRTNEVYELGEFLKKTV